MRPMYDPEKIARETLKCALSWEPAVCLIGNLMACEVAALAARQIDTCPKCGATAWVNIDCDLCNLCSRLIEGEAPDVEGMARMVEGER
jgi:hypothetical protein